VQRRRNLRIVLAVHLILAMVASALVLGPRQLGGAAPAQVEDFVPVNFNDWLLRGPDTTGVGNPGWRQPCHA